MTEYMKFKCYFTKVRTDEPTAPKMKITTFVLALFVCLPRFFNRIFL